MPSRIPAAASLERRDVGRIRAAARRFLLRLAVSFGVFSVLGFLFGLQKYWEFVLYGEPVGFWPVIQGHLLGWIPVILLCPAIVGLGRRLPLRRRRLLPALAIHLLTSLVFATIQAIALYVFSRSMKGLAIWDPRALALHVLDQLVFFVLVYWVILTVVGLVDSYQRSRRHEMRLSRLEAELARAELNALKMQLQPHFLFNTLHTVSSLLHENPAEADRTIRRLSDLLRLTLQRSGVQEVPLREELEFLGVYLEIEKARFEERLRIALDVAPETLDARVPSLMLQPLVENAVRHGASRRTGGGKVEIRSRREGDRLVLEIENDAVEEAPAGDSVSYGLGLQNTKDRLAHLHGNDHDLSIRRGERGEFLVSVRIPFLADEESQPQRPRSEARR